MGYVCRVKRYLLLTGLNAKFLQFLEILLYATRNLPWRPPTRHCFRDLGPSMICILDCQAPRQERTNKKISYLCFSPAGISVSNFSSRCCSESDQGRLNVSDGASRLRCLRVSCRLAFEGCGGSSWSDWSDEPAPELACSTGAETSDPSVVSGGANNGEGGGGGIGDAWTDGDG